MNNVCELFIICICGKLAYAQTVESEFGVMWMNVGSCSGVQHPFMSIHLCISECVYTCSCVVCAGEQRAPQITGLLPDLTEPESKTIGMLRPTSGAAKISCQASGEPQPTFRWELDGRPAENYSLCALHPHNTRTTSQPRSISHSTILYSTILVQSTILYYTLLVQSSLVYTSCNTRTLPLCALFLQLCS